MYTRQDSTVTFILSILAENTNPSQELYSGLHGTIVKVMFERDKENTTFMSVTDKTLRVFGKHIRFSLGKGMSIGYGPAASAKGPSRAGATFSLVFGAVA